MKYPTPAELRELTAEERLRLLDDVWETFAADPDSLPVSEEHRRELDRRQEAFQRSPEAGESWPDLRRRLMCGFQERSQAKWRLA